MKSQPITIIQRNFFRLMRLSLFGDDEQIEPMSAAKWQQLFRLSCTHGAAGVVARGIEMCADQFFRQIPEALLQQWSEARRQVVLANKAANAVQRNIAAELELNQLRPMLCGSQVFSALYGSEPLRQPSSVCFFFPFATQGRKANKWAIEHSDKVLVNERRRVVYSTDGVVVEHNRNLMTLSNKLLQFTLGSIVESEVRDNPPSFVIVDGVKYETLSPTLTLFHQLLVMASDIINDGILASRFADLGVYLRTRGDKVDFVKLEQWTASMKMTRIVSLISLLMQDLLHFSADELPFSDNGPSERLTRQADGFVFSSAVRDDGSAVKGRLGSSLSRFRLYPTESFTNLFSHLTHSITHVEE